MSSPSCGSILRDKDVVQRKGEEQQGDSQRHEAKEGVSEALSQIRVRCVAPGEAVVPEGVWTPHDTGRFHCCESVLF